ncbi:type VII secretion integral membrane protein EccD [Micromonospora musae]|uniref:Type VII secretion integral membrane protein EccD n=1 Tax=Micromonospora musae TaxID=1894970 RepID=A0A3A9YFE3_9ACTN|nr:type VII secretion integral membrane protein EccD [Micromonospora musae]RKN33094.1 type VII secretion integral membrane protein EccD [Micromonospora musae]
MTAPGGLSLARVTIAAPKRRMDVALPNAMLVAELMPHLLRHAGEGLGDVGEQQGGWVLRRATGTLLEANRNLSAQGVRDGELLHLAPGRDEWPDLAYDDVVEVIASSARRAGRPWSDDATRRCALAVTAALLGVGLIALLAIGSPWLVPALVALGVALLLAIAGPVLSRAMGDATTGAVVAAAGLPYGFFGGALLATPDGTPVTGIGAPGLLLGSSTLLVFSLIGYATVAGVQRLFMAGLAASVTGLLAALLSYAGVSPAGAAAATLTTVIGLLPGYPLIASWLGKLPVPELPDRPEEILKDRPVPERAKVFVTVARAAELLTGMLLSVSICGALAIAFLLNHDQTPAGALLALCGSGAMLLRARLFPTAEQRIPLLAGGLLGLVALAMGEMSGTGSGGGRLLVLVGVLAAAAVVLAAGLRFSRRRPTPYLGRAADIADVVAIMALIPLACAVIGLFGAIQGMFASIGG